MLNKMTLDELDAGYEKGKVTPEEMPDEDYFLSWLKAQAKIAEHRYMASLLSEAPKYRSRMETLHAVLKKYKDINP